MNPDTSAGEQQGLPPGQTLRKRKVEFYYQVVSRRPFFKIKGWDPPAELDKISLSQFIAALPIPDRAHGLHLRIEGPGITAEQEILLGQDNRLVIFVNTIKRYIRDYIKTHRDADRILCYAVEIEEWASEQLSENDEAIEDFHFG
jgi:hypothetical protein